LKPKKKESGRYTQVFKEYGKHLKQKADDGSHNLMLKTASAIPSKKLSTDITRVMMEKRQNTSSPNKPTAPSPDSFATANEMSGFTDDTLLNPHNPLGHQRDDY